MRSFQRVHLTTMGVTISPASSRMVALLSALTLRTVLLLIAFAAVIANQTHAQKKTEVRQQVWLGYFNQSRLSAHSGVWLDLHYRLTDRFVGERTMLVARAAYIYYAGDRTRLMAGYAYADRYSGDQRIPEHRPWQQIQWVERKKRFDLTQALRIEQRFRKGVVDEKVTEEFAFNWRFRYSVSVLIPLTGEVLEPKQPYLLASNEIHINAGRSIVNNYLDQNRSFLGLGYQFTSQLSAHAGYLFVFLQDPAPVTFIHTHAIRFYILHNLDFRNTERD